MADVVASVKRVTEIMAEITAASQEQAAGIDQVSQAVNQLDQITQQNAALVEEAAAATETMRNEAGALDGAVDVFHIVGLKTSSVKAQALASQVVERARSSAATSSPSGTVQKTAPPRLTRPSIKGADGDDWSEF